MQIPRLSPEHVTVAKKKLLSDFWRKLLALALAVIVYFAVMPKTHNTQREISGVPIELVLPADAINIEQEVPISLFIEGSADAIRDVNAKSFRCRIELRSYHSGRAFRQKVTPSDIRGPSGIRVTKVEPEYVPVCVEKVISRQVPVSVIFEKDKLPADLFASDKDCVPRDVQVSGPESLVANMKKVDTLPIPLDRTVTEGFDYVASLRPLDGVTVSPNRVNVQVEVMRRYEAVTLRGISARLLCPAGWSEQFRGTPETAVFAVTVSGLKSRLEKLTERNLRVYLDLSEVNAPGQYRIEPGCLITGFDDSELKIREIVPRAITVKVEKIVK